MNLVSPFFDDEYSAALAGLDEQERSPRRHGQQRLAWRVVHWNISRQVVIKMLNQAGERRRHCRRRWIASSPFIWLRKSVLSQPSRVGVL